MKKLFSIKSSQSKCFMVCLLIFMLASCKPEEQVYDFVSPAQVGDSDAAADKWALGAYNELSLMFRYSEFPAVLEYDDDYTTGPSWAFGELGAGNFQGNSKQTDPLWTYSYVLIHRANRAITNIETMTKTTPEYKNNVLGEMYFLKAFSYFLLVRAYGDVPIFVKAVDDGEDINQPRQPIKDVYAHIIDLLTQAKDMMYTNAKAQPGRATAGAAASLLAKVYVTIGSASLQSGDVIVRGGKPYDLVNNVQVRTMPSPITFHKKQVKGYESFDSKQYFKLAMDMADDVIKGKYGAYQLVNFNDMWTQAGKNNGEHIFSVQSYMGDQDLGNHLTRDFAGLVENNQIISGMWYGLRDHWYKLFEPQDLRIVQGVAHRWSRNFDYANHIGTFYPNNDEYRKKALGYDQQTGVDGSGNPIITHVPPVAPYNDGLNYGSGTDANYIAFLNKFAYPSDRSKDQSDVNYPFLRFADVKLIYAEAANEYNGAPTSEALASLNDVRVRSNATPKQMGGAGGVGTLVAFRSAVLEERAMELALEGDRRWDLIRWGIYLDVMNSIQGNDEVGVTKVRQERNLLYPLPISEVSTNINIHGNNPGWN
ncbi:RagB/SusD family nutrient uptake outer membrane protein [Mucilaginibacter segetis]|uniref:RagB/SusD family nutrient uptake outer membrane protein n=1 Tax=Mucilaginibacter segetis TaxID=2793071 RepID=A0A934UMJ6_9SPHI|nr:RagB/SusD family nutrient uptake outer membrane protein [Mucilaginibacter segetis]MBK0379718.1 RagB/SusD family nutrient uptake outer membrane protein [Mucilaginibacter segetis]